MRTHLLILLLIWTYTVSFGQKNKSDTLQKRMIDTYAKDFKDSLQGSPLIDFETTLLTGEKFKLSDHSGKVILLNFWFIGCPPCMGEIPDLNKIYRTYKDSDVVILSLATNPADQLNRFNEGKYSRPPEKIEYAIAPECQDISSKYSVTGYPTTIFIDKKGIIRLSYAGASPQSIKKYAAFYGDANLSKSWKKILKKIENEQYPEVSEILSAILDDLLKE